MSQSIAITCEVCDGSSFYKKDGISICRTCQTESQEHGQDTVVDADTLGLFTTGAGPLQLQRVTVRPKKTKAVRTKKYIKSPTSFTTTDLSSFVLKGWVDELIALGADPSLKEITLALWSLRLQLSGQGFGNFIRSKFISHRDLQVKLFKRKRLLSGVERRNFERRRSKHVPIVSSDEEDNGLDARELKRKRARKRRKFLKNLVDETLSEGSGNSSIGSNTSWLSNYDQGFDTSDVDKSPERHPPASSNTSNQSNHESDWEDLSINASSLNVSSTSEGDNSEKSVDEDNEPDREIQGMILDRAFRYRSHIGQRSPFSKPQMLATLLLALSITKNNQLTVADILFWARTGAISFLNPWALIPKCMKAYVRIDAALMHPFIPTHSIFMEMRGLGCIFELGEVNFNEHGIIENTLKRYLEELALPKELFEMVVSSLEPHTGLFDLTVLLGGPKINKPGKTKDCCEYRVLAMILFCLKYLYVLDDSVELIYSDYARTWNQAHENESSSPMFDIGAWLAMSKVRLQLVCKYAFHLRPQYHHLFSEVEMSPGTLVQKYEFEERHSKQNYTCLKRQKYLDFITTLPLFKRHASASIPYNSLEIATSLQPLSDFSKHFLSDLPSGHEPITAYAKASLKKLKSMGDAQIKWPEVDPSAKDKDFKFHWKKIEGKAIDSHHIAHGYRFRSHLLNSRRLGFKRQEGMVYPRFRHYWFLNYNLQKMNTSHQSGPTDRALERIHILQLPDNFQWIVSYFAAFINCSPATLLNELGFVENQIRSVSNTYFGALKESG